MDDNKLNFTKEQDEFFKSLVQKALKGEHMEKEFICSLRGLYITKKYIVGCQTVINSFNSICSAMLETYLEQIRAEAQDIDLLISMKQFEHCRNFYSEEMKIAKDMIKEYRAYVFGGHILDTLLGNPRKEEDLVDYRTIPWKWF